MITAGSIAGGEQARREDPAPRPHLLGFGMPEVVRMARVIQPGRKRHFAGPALFQATLLGALFLVDSILPVLYLFALVSSFWAVFRLRAWTEHVGAMDTHRLDCGGVFAYVVFPHNTWCHFEHHQRPFLTYQALPDARQLDPDVPVVTLRELFRFFAAAPEPLPAGSPGKTQGTREHDSKEHDLPLVRQGRA